jgi:hypothetical protein
MPHKKPVAAKKKSTPPATARKSGLVFTVELDREEDAITSLTGSRERSLRRTPSIPSEIKLPRPAPSQIRSSTRVASLIPRRAFTSTAPDTTTPRQEGSSARTAFWNPFDHSGGSEYRTFGPGFHFRMQYDRPDPFAKCPNQSCTLDQFHIDAHNPIEPGQMWPHLKCDFLHWCGS